MGREFNSGKTNMMLLDSGLYGQCDVASVEFDDNGVIVGWCRNLGLSEAMELNNRETETVSPLILRDSDGFLTLIDGALLGASASTMNYSLERVRYRRAIASGCSTADWKNIHGMKSQTDGLAKWAGFSPVNLGRTFDREGFSGCALSVSREDLNSIVIGGPLGLKFVPSYSFGATSKRGAYSVKTFLSVCTESRDLKSWKKHSRTHLMLQDLMTLIYGKPCRSRLVEVMREDDQDDERVDGPHEWRSLYDPTYGRSVDEECGLKDGDYPLFHFKDVSPKLLEKLVSEWRSWERPVWIASSAIVYKNVPVEVSFLQVAVALEALGYALINKDSDISPRSVNYKGYLLKIFDSIGYDPVCVVGKNGDREAWSNGFNEVYKGAKHADKRLPEHCDVLEKMKEGLLLVRCWLANQLGVPKEIVLKNLSVAN
ncbi:ApeA N-terminal domain 1-containing protein [Dermabacteraceae bacterium P13138]